MVAAWFLSRAAVVLLATTPMLLALLLAVPATATTALTADPNATIFWNVIKGCTTKDPTWTVDNPLYNWSGSANCPGPNCGFAMSSTASGKCNGPVDLSAMRTFTYFVSLDFGSSGATGTVDLTSLPANLTSLYLPENELSGTVNLTRLPSQLAYVFLGKNNFSGNLVLSQLPSDLVTLDVSANDFTGTVDLTKLPQNLQTLELENNKFTGTPNCTQLPQSLTLLSMHGNEFTGTPDLTNLNSQLDGVLLANNNFSGTVSINVTSLVNQTIDLRGNALFAVWLTQFPDEAFQGLFTDPSVRVFNTTNATAPLRAGVFVSSASKHALRISASGTATLGSCTSTVSAGSFRVFTDGTSYLADSGVVAAALAPCLPTTFGTPQFLLHPSSGTLLLVTSGAQNITFTRRG